MSNENDILKRILLNMRYDSSMTLNENYNHIIYEDDTKNTDYQYEIDGYITYKTIVPNKTITVPDVRSGIGSGIEYRTNLVDPLSWHDNKRPYNDESAKRLFSKACSKIEYYIDSNYNQCKTYKIFTKEIVSNKNLELYVKSFTDTYRYTKETYPNSNVVKYYYTTKKGWVEATGENLEKLKNWDINEKIFDGAGTNISKNVPIDQQNCTKLDEETCVKWSWNSMTIYGGIDKGLKRFKLYSNLTKLKKREGTTYSACVGIPKDSEEKYPWFTQYVGFYDESKFQKSDDPNVTWRCPEESITTLPTIPTFAYGNEGYNISISNDEEREKYVNQRGDDYLSTQQGKSYESEQQYKTKFNNLTKLKTVLGGGIRIRGK